MLAAATAKFAAPTLSAEADIEPVKLKPVDVEQAPNSGTRVMVARPAIEPTISSHEPIYFLLGNNDKSAGDARFQISFKYRRFDAQSAMATFMSVFSKMYFAYTQTSVWDLGTDYAPFRDSSYRPSLFYQ